MESVTVQVDHAREGCEKIALNVIELAGGASRLLNTDDGTDYTRQAYALVIHAIDEAGKMIRIIKEMMVAESRHDKTISIGGFYSHRYKGSEAAAIGLVAVDWFNDLLRTRAAGFGEVENEDSLEQYKSHLQKLQGDFDKERERVLYVDYENGTWIQPISAREVDIVLDAQLLAMTAFVVHGAMKANKTFSEVYSIIQKVQNSVAKLFREYNGTTPGESLEPRKAIPR